jgi:hypothetical protein
MTNKSSWKDLPGLLRDLLLKFKADPDNPALPDAVDASIEACIDAYIEEILTTADGDADNAAVALGAFSKAINRVLIHRGRGGQAKPAPTGLTPAGEILPALIERHKPLSRIKERLTTPLEDLDAAILYQHSVLCQTGIPYRDPGDAQRLWERTNGLVRLEIQAGRLLDPSTDHFVDVGLPFGPKPRLVLYHLNAEAKRTQSPVVELEDSLTAFVYRIFKHDDGRTIRTVKEQLNRLAAADFRFGMNRDGRAVTIKGTVIKGLELWTPRDPRQKVLWPTVVQFSTDYFESLMRHAVPLNEDAVRQLSHSAMGLDTYTWMAQRLYRVATGKPAFVPWISLKQQFGQGYSGMNDFRRVFKRTLGQVKLAYPEARFTLDGKGMQLYQSPPPIAPRALV